MSTTEQTGLDPLNPAERRQILREHLEREKSRRHVAEAALADALEGLREMIPYVPEYFADKHDLRAYIQRAESALEAGSRGGRASTHWCVAWGGEDPNDCAGRLEYDDEAECREMTDWIPGSSVARRTVVSLPWEAVPAGEPAP